MKIFSYFSTLLVFILSSTTVSAKASTTGPWKTWKEGLQKRYMEKFSPPSITHHIYLKKDGESAYLDQSGPYPRLTLKKCEDCEITVVRTSAKKIVLKNDKTKSEQVLVLKKQTKIPGVSQLFVAPYFYVDTNEVRVFVYDLSQELLKEKRKRLFFDYQKELSVQAQFQWLKKSSAVKIQRSDGSTKSFQKVAQLRYNLAGKPQLLSVYDFGSDQYKEDKDSMLLYRDYSNGKKTYGAGRFLNVSFGKKMGQMKDGDKVKVDFNYSYNPPCAASTGYHCPLPQDLVKASVTAGEKYKKAGKKPH